MLSELDKGRNIENFVKGLTGEDVAIDVSRMALPVLVGTLADGTPHVIDLANNTSTLIFGDAGTGKTFELLTILGSLIYSKAPEYVKIELIDSVDSILLSKLGDMEPVTLTDARGALHTLRRVRDEIAARNELLVETGHDNIRWLRHSLTLNNNTEGLSKVPFIVVAVDDVSSLISSSDEGIREEVSALLEEISLSGRSVGVHLIATSASVSQKKLPKSVLYNSSAKIGFNMVGDDISQHIKGAKDVVSGVGESLVSSFEFSEVHKVNNVTFATSDHTLSFLKLLEGNV